MFVKYQVLIKLFASAGIYLNCMFENQSYKFSSEKCLTDVNLPLIMKQLMTKIFKLTEKDAKLFYFSVSESSAPKHLLQFCSWLVVLKHPNATILSYGSTDLVTPNHKTPLISTT